MAANTLVAGWRCFFGVDRNFSNEILTLQKPGIKAGSQGVRPESIRGMSELQTSDTNRKAVGPRSRETAMATATLRALAANDERKKIRGSDYLAEMSLPADRKILLKDAAARDWVMKNKIAPGMYEFMIARTAFFDHVVEQAFREIIPQVVFLGAGYDTRPYRFKHLVKGTRIFELDLEPTQRRKRDLPDQAGVPIPEQLIFVSINFDTDQLKVALPGAGYNTQQKTLFVWEGVTYYLSAEAAHAAKNYQIFLAIPLFSVIYWLKNSATVLDV
jgi:methyltransferase (TIGR00027 family)